MTKFPPLVFILGYLGLVPFVIDPLWLSVAPATVPAWLDAAWQVYAIAIAAFMAGSFWGMGLFVAASTNGRIGLLLAATQALLAALTIVVPREWRLAWLAVVFVLLALSELWREHTFDPESGYLRLRLGLTFGVLVCLGWRAALGNFG
ncbi:MAG: DUF3429 family protein [Nevskiaceae bacterium]|nr:MAG: DUF3429 family protein [Nevskiaceae bacterium]TBR72006.1 MAG: DUF3429 family protein [Nevskiaceae bacterium]